MKQWDTHAQYDIKQAKLAEMRFKAREFEQRITREQVCHTCKQVKFVPCQSGVEGPMPMYDAHASLV